MSLDRGVPGSASGGVSVHVRPLLLTRSVRFFLQTPAHTVSIPSKANKCALVPKGQVLELQNFVELGSRKFWNFRTFWNLGPSTLKTRQELG